MIAVIADDFSGAAELGGIGIRYHLSVEVNTMVNTNTTADVLIIATDARSLPKQEAVQVMQQHMQQLMALHPELIFKKTDSVLRGHIVAELMAQLPIANCDKAVLVPANPVLGRTIEDGRYYLHGQPVHLTSFSQDPDFAITSCVVEDMLRSNGHAIHIKKVNESLPATGIIVGEATATNDLEAWAARIDQQTLAAGAAGFFEAIIRNRFRTDVLSEVEGSGVEGSDEGPERSRRAVAHLDSAALRLFVCGSTFANSREAIQKIKAAGGPVCYMPGDMIKSDITGKYTYVKWANETVALIKKHGKAIVAIHPDSTKGIMIRAGQLREKMAGLVNEVLQRSIVQELFIEGGATAWSVVQASGITQFIPVQEMAPGVVRMHTRHDNLYITVKPGSYAWPEGVWDF
jgi:uncharacterized protein YgbK (DUF1537 family)